MATDWKWKILPDPKTEYVSKPVVIRAIRMTRPFFVYTLEGPVVGRKGDWLIKGTQDELYPCRDSVFKRKYKKYFPLCKSCEGTGLIPMEEVACDDCDGTGRGPK